MNHFLKTQRVIQTGFSLVEIMVAMVIGLIGSIIILQVFSVFEGQKRTTAGGDDAQNIGAIALAGLQRDVSQGGYGMIAPKLTVCPLVIAPNPATPNISLPDMVPVVVNPLKGTNAALPAIPPNALTSAVPAAIADPNTDSIMVMYGSSNTIPEGSLITNINLATNEYTIAGGTAASGVAGQQTTGGHGFTAGDYVLADSGVGNRFAVRGAVVCAPLYVAQVTAASLGTAPVNAIPAGFVFSLNTVLQNKPILYNLGPTPAVNVYAVIDGNLSVCNYMAANCAASKANWTSIASGIISMRAVCNPGGSSLSVALVTRNAVPEPDPNYTSPLPTWSNSVLKPIVPPTVNLAQGFTWQKYRYKTFETTIPLRNTVWSGAQGCR